MLQSKLLHSDLALQTLAQSPDGMLLIDAGQRVQWSNPQGRELLGIDAADALGMDAATLWPPQQREAFANALATASREGPSLPLMLPVTPGSSITLEVRFIPIQDANGQNWIALACRRFEPASSMSFHPQHRRASERLAAVLNEITDPAELTHAVAGILGSTLQVSRAGYGTIDSAHETITIERDWNAPGVPSLAGILHFRDYGSYIEDLKRGATVVIADAYTDPRTAATADALRDISAVSVVNMPVSESGGFVALLFLSHAQPRVWTDEELAFIAEVVQRTRNAVEHRRAEQELTALAASLEDLVVARTEELERMWRLSRDLVLVVNEADEIVTVNPAWTRLLGWKNTEVVGRPFREFIHPEDLPSTNKVRIGLAAGKELKLFENRYRHHDGSYHWIEWNAVSNDGLVHAVGRDVTVQKEAAATLERTEDQLRQAQKMEAIGKLTGGVAHDFNNLLQVIGGNLQLLSSHISGNHSAERRVANAMEGVTRGSRLAAQLLAFGRQQPLLPKVINVGRVIRGMDELLRRSLGEAIEVETVVMGGLWNVKADSAQIENALLNLSINARDAMDDRGRLTLEAGNASLDQRYCEGQTDVTPGQYVMIAVTDTGAGMPLEVITRAFEPFFTTKPAGRGTGLGLSMVYGFVKQSGGHIKIYSEIGEGTTIKIYLPRSTEAEDPQVEVDKGPVVGGVETVLVAEDDDAVRETVVAMLGELGYRVLKARDATSALSIIDSGAAIDVLFTDVIMPGALKSPELARKARERIPNLAVLFTSGYTQNAIVHGGRLDEGIDLLTKPYTREALARRLRQVINAARPVGSTSTQSNVPANDHSASASATQAAGAAPPREQTRRLRILLCEDEWLIRASVADMLALRGYEVIETGDATQARGAFEKHPVDLLLTDVGLPGQSGVDLARTLRELSPGLPVLFATGRGDMEDIESDPRTGFMRKPYSMDELERAIATLMAATGSEAEA